MIKNRQDLKRYLHEERRRAELDGLPTIKDRILQNEKYYIYHYLIALRHVEYYINTDRKCDLRFYIWWYIYKRIGFKIRCRIAPNTIDAGLMIYHTGDLIWVHDNCHIGCNCTLRPGVVFGRKSIMEPAKNVHVGNNCDFGIGTRIIGDVCIGDNVSTGANCVITKDVPKNSIVVGIPGRIIKKENRNEK